MSKHSDSAMGAALDRLTNHAGTNRVSHAHSNADGAIAPFVDSAVVAAQISVRLVRRSGSHFRRRKEHIARFGRRFFVVFTLICELPVHHGHRHIDLLDL